MNGAERRRKTQKYPKMGVAGPQKIEKKRSAYWFELPGVPNSGDFPEFITREISEILYSDFYFFSPPAGRPLERERVGVHVL